MGLRNKRPRQNVYSVNRKGKKSGRKIDNAISHFKKLQARVDHEGNTLWIQNAIEIVMKKFKKYSINANKI